MLNIKIKINQKNKVGKFTWFERKKKIKMQQQQQQQQEELIRQATGLLSVLLEYCTKEGTARAC